MKESEIRPKDIFDEFLRLAKIDTKKGQEKNRAFVVAKGIYVREIKKAENAKKWRTTLTIVKIG